MIINIVLSNGWSVIVRKECARVWDAILCGKDEFIEVEDLNGNPYLLAISHIVCVKDVSA